MVEAALKDLDADLVVEETQVGRGFEDIPFDKKTGRNITYVSTALKRLRKDRVEISISAAGFEMDPSERLYVLRRAGDQWRIVARRKVVIF